MYTIIKTLCLGLEFWNIQLQQLFSTFVFSLFYLIALTFSADLLYMTVSNLSPCKSQPCYFLLSTHHLPNITLSCLLKSLLAKSLVPAWSEDWQKGTRLEEIAHRQTLSLHLRNDPSLAYINLSSQPKSVRNVWNLHNDPHCQAIPLMDTKWVVIQCQC